MKSFVTKVFRFFLSWGFLKFILWAVTLLILLYVEEDWRGARAWAATKAKWEAKGESLDYSGNRFIPPPISDSKNLAAIPLFRLEPDPDDANKNDLRPLALERAMRAKENYEPGGDLPPVIHWQVGEVSDPDKLNIAILKEYTAAFKGIKPPPKPIDQFEALYPFLSELRTAAVNRPDFRLALDYSFNPPDGRALGPVTFTIRLSRILAIHALLALNDDKSDLAVDDLKINLQIADGIRRDPTLVAGLVAMGIVGIGQGVIFDGLAHHQWSDANLVEIEHLLSSMNLLSDGQFAMRCEAAAAMADMEYYRHSRLNLYGLLQGMDNEGRTIRAPWWMIRLIPQWTSGWWDLNKSQVADSILRSISALDPEKHRAYPEISRDLQYQVDQAKLRPLALAPWNIWATVALGPINGTMEKFPAFQVWVDEARIACALERYRLAHAAYPAALDALSPAYIDALPHDVTDGAPYRYRLQSNGAYLLYSVGWNQTDDGGKASYQYNNDAHQKAIDYDHGDWVWPTPK
jgi:tetrahydromethanopterin S-methyltransferase subunit F